MSEVPLYLRKLALLIQGPPLQYLRKLRSGFGSLGFGGWGLVLRVWGLAFGVWGLGVGGAT